ncbi:MAG: zinc ribbon domain-containing protein [Gemmatimonadetes bacterium]|nr:zinc ribbon domain-containing protein [Gemmatimonadota bacterium]
MTNEHLQAVDKASCAACGGHATWDPGRQALICPYCGTVAPGELDQDSGKVREIDLVKTLREMPEELRGWKAEKRSVKCRSCHAVSVFDPERVGQNCGFCGSPELVDYDEIKAPLRPQSILPFRVDERAVRTNIKKWLAKKWLAPGRLKKSAWVDTVKGFYLPYWTFDAQVEAEWTASSGTYYYTTEQVRGSDGKMTTRQKRHTRWRPAAGRVSHFFDDEPVPGTQGVRKDLLKRIEPFPTGDSLPYDTAYLSGFVVEHYQIVLIDAAQEARASMDRKLESLCASQIPGDTYRNLQVSADYSARTFKHILVPVWVLTYGFSSKSFQLLANGVTGEIAGDYPKSWIKIVLLVLGILAVVAVLAVLAQG